MAGLRPDVDPDGLLEYSVVFTDRALNHMSDAFQRTINDVSSTLRRAYNARSATIVPGTGTVGMESVARQFATDQHCLVIRNGLFSYRWTQIFEMGSIPASHTVLSARQQSDSRTAPFAPAPIDEVVATIEAERPAVVFAPHVETASGILLPDEYLRAVARAVHSVGGMFVLDCIASGAVWVDMADVGIDVLISAPQKGWSGSPFGAFVMLGEVAEARLAETANTSFAIDLGRWRQIMAAYEDGGHAYHATLPTDSITRLQDVMAELERMGFGEARRAQQQLGDRVRALLADRGFASVAAPGFAAPGVVVSYTDDAEISSGSKFAAEGLQIAGGVPLMCGERDDFSTFRLGLFGIDKLSDVDAAVDRLEGAVDRLGR